ncbi:hypothetical protein ACFQ36_11080 [Arthrobacter sp. GCM10027362]|uniref:hypothetical protein n=1 Tax=Arthrobacter sp. GCM10027362 TaxID=3273379 RepID=UPI003630C7ED
MAEQPDVRSGARTPCHDSAFETHAVYLGEPGKSEAIVEVRCTGPGCGNTWYPDTDAGRDVRKVLGPDGNGRLQEWPLPVTRLRSLPRVLRTVLFAFLAGTATVALGVLAGLPAHFNVGAGMMLTAAFMSVPAFTIGKDTDDSAHRDAFLLFFLSWIPGAVGSVALVFGW